MDQSFWIKTLALLIIGFIFLFNNLSQSAPVKKYGVLLKRNRRIAPWQCRSRKGVRVAADFILQPRMMPVTPKESPSEQRRVKRKLIMPMCPWRSTDINRPITPKELRAFGFRPRGKEQRQKGNWWPREEPPICYANLKPQKFLQSLRTLCPMTVDDSDITKISQAIVKWGKYYEVDPFLLGGLVYHFSQCNAKMASSFGIGLTAINYGMYARGLKKGKYRYWIYNHIGWRPASIEASHYPFNKKSLRNIDSNIYFSALLLRSYYEQRLNWPRLCGSQSYRHYVSKFIWGDRVRNTSPEDLVLTARRRLLAYYHNRKPALKIYQGLELGCPLDGCPRRITSPIGEKRASGKRKHTGVDLMSQWGEPVLAIADGFVSFAGVDLSHNILRNWPAAMLRFVRNKRMGPRGVFIQIEHKGGFRSDYMHLSTFIVKKGMRVRRGDLIGYVGRSGMKVSDEHLHLGVFKNKKMLNPIEVFYPHFIRHRTKEEIKRDKARHRGQQRNGFKRSNKQPPLF